MPKIIWKGIINSEEEFPTSKIPEGAIKINGEEDMKKMQMKTLPFMIPLALIYIICMLTKTFMAGEKVVNLVFLFIGILLGFFLIIVHELLHAIAFPNHAIVYIGIMPKSFAAVALSSSPVKRNRFIFMSILPIVLGIIPLFIFCISPNDLIELNGLIFGMALVGITSVYPDIYNIFNTLKIVPKDYIIQNNKNETYYYKK